MYPMLPIQHRYALSIIAFTCFDGSSYLTHVASLCQRKAEQEWQAELHTLRAVFDRLDKNGDGKVDKVELAYRLRKLGHPDTSRSDVEEMIWEVDERGDGVIDWEEFKLMYIRCKNDKSGLEPRKLYNVVEFMFFDKDESCRMSVEECITLLRERYSVDLIPSLLREHFKKQGLTEGLDFSQYVAETSSQIVAWKKVTRALGKASISEASLQLDPPTMMPYNTEKGARTHRKPPVAGNGNAAPMRSTPRTMAAPLHTPRSSTNSDANGNGAVTKKKKTKKKKAQA
jgi:calmodulin